MSQAGNFLISGSFPPGTVVQTLEGNTGGPIGPDGSNNINVVGDGIGITITGNAGTNTLTASLIGGGVAAEEFETDVGTAIPVAGVITIKADTAIQHAGSSVGFSGIGNNVQLDITDGNLNTIVGGQSGNATISGQSNTVFGHNSALNLTSGNNNTMMGTLVAQNLTTGAYNVLLGGSAGSFYAGNETSNIIIGSQAAGVIGESNTLRIGSGAGAGIGQLNRSFIHGIRGITPTTNDGIPVYISSDGQLGTVGTGLTSSFDTDSGTATPTAGVIEIIADNATLHSGASVSFSGSGNTVLLNLTDPANNTFVGRASGNLTVSGNNNTVFGYGAAASLTSATFNTIVGTSAAFNFTSGSRNVLIGATAGLAYTTNEDSNIIIGLADGSVGESNTLRIGDGSGSGAGQLNRAFISGIDGVSVGSVATVVTESGDQLGTAVITAGTGITVTPGANLITISASGTSVLDYTNVTTTPYVVLVTDNYLSVDSSGGAITVQLPNAATLGVTYVVKDRTGSAGTNAITVTTVGGAVNIDGATTFVMNTNYQAISIIGNGSTYEVF